MRHPSPLVLRRLVDEPAAVADADREHVAACPSCLAALAGDDAGDAPVPAVAASRRSSTVLRRPAVAVLVVAAVLTGAGAAAADSWFSIFRTEQVAPVGYGAADLLALPDLRYHLESVGDVVVTEEPDLRPVADAAAAEARTGLDVPRVATLPRGVSGEPVHRVGGPVGVELTFSTELAAQAAAGATLPPPPPGLAGSTVRLVAGPGAVQVWTQPTGVPSLVVGRAVAPTAFSDGVPFGTARDYLLSLPGVPDDVATQLRAFTADGSTLPLPVALDRFSTSSVRVDGAAATVITARDRTMAAVVWVADGVVTVVAGPLDADEVLSVARDLR